MLTGDTVNHVKKYHEIPIVSSPEDKPFRK